MRRNIRQSERGQAAFEMLAVIPAFLLIFAIMYQFFSLSWNSQYVHVKSRSDVMADIGDAPCGEAGKSAQSNITTESTVGPGSYDQSKSSIVVCN